MHVVVLGAGMIGQTVVNELSAYEEIKKITVVDGVQKNIDKCLHRPKSEKILGKLANLTSETDIYDTIKDSDAAIACLPHSLSMSAVRAAISAKCHLIDLVGSNYGEKAKLNQKAQEAGVIIVPGCGVAPGITNFLAAQGVEMLDEAEEAVMVCGGIPRYPVPPLWYQIVFRLESVMGLYTRPALAAENGQLIHLPPLTGLETISFPEPVGSCEAVVTDAHSVAFTLKDKVNKIYEKTVRYAGHWSKMSILAELGFLEDEEITVNDEKVNIRQVTEKILTPKLKGESIEDITVLRVTVRGKKDKKNVTHIWEMVDFYDHGRNITSMAKTTAIPAMLITYWILNRIITQTGVIPIEKLIIGKHFHPFLHALEEKGIKIEHFMKIE